MSLRHFALTLSMLAVAATPVTAQVTSPDSTLVDRVVAVVGDSVVLLSQIEEQVALMKVRGESVPTDPTQLKSLEKGILDQKVNQLLVLQAAAKDTVVMNEIDESRIRQAAEQEIENKTLSFGGQAAMQQALKKDGWTLAQYRAEATSQLRQHQIQEAYIQSKLQNAPPVEVTDAELHEAFQEESGSMPQRPRYMNFDQVVIAPQASDTAKARAKAFAESLLQRIRNGESFSELAKRYSDDPGSAPLGGQLGWLRRGRTVKAFEDAAFSLAPGQISNVVHTEFGYHIIKVEHRRPGEVQASHILITPKIHQADVVRAEQLADSVLAKARADSSMENLYSEYGDPLSPDSMTATYAQLDSLPAAYGALRLATVGQVIGPLRYETAQGGSTKAGSAPPPRDMRFAIVKVKEIHEAGAWTFAEVKTRLAQALERQKQLDRLLKSLRSKTYIDIRM